MSQPTFDVPEPTGPNNQLGGVAVVPCANVIYPATVQNVMQQSSNSKQQASTGNSNSNKGMDTGPGAGKSQADQKKDPSVCLAVQPAQVGPIAPHRLRVGTRLGCMVCTRSAPVVRA